MLGAGSLVFLNPWVLGGLLALPVLWWLLRAIPPAPQTRVFPGVRLLLGLEDEDRQSDRTPWWLLLLRIIALAAAIVGFSQPVLNPSDRVAGGSGPLLVLMDQGWASAPDWEARVAAARSVLDEADEQGREVYFWPLADGGVPRLGDASSAKRVLASTVPQPFAPDHAAAIAALTEGTVKPTETVWLHDGLDHGATGDLAVRLSEAGPLRLIGPETVAMGLTPLRLENGALAADVLRAGAGDAEVPVVAFARAEGGGERRIAVGRAAFTGQEQRAAVTFDLPVELQGSVTRIMLGQGASAGGAAFADGAIQRVKAIVVGPENTGQIASLTSPTHYLAKAITPWADLQQRQLSEAIAQDPAALILIDQGDMAPADREKITEWVDSGGLLIRFAGPRLAAAISDSNFRIDTTGEDLLPVRLRRGGRVLGGALAWSAPRTVGPFPDHSPFRGLTPPDEVAVRTQVLAEPSPDLSGKVWAALDDGTPLVTADRLGDGMVVLFHVTSDAEWSSLPLSGLFVEMLGRLMAIAPGRAAGTPTPEELADTLWRAERLMGADGRPAPVTELTEPVSGERLSGGGVGPDMPPGVYLRANAQAEGAGRADSVVVNVHRQEDSLSPAPAAPAGAVVETLGGAETVRYGPLLLAAALALVFLDVLATLFVSGRLAGRGLRSASAAVAVIAACALAAPPAEAEDDPALAIAATAETTLGYVLTGAESVDRVSQRALAGLGRELARRTAVEPGPPVGVKPGQDDLSFYPVLYWPLTASTLPDKPALDALASYLTGGGLLIIDTQNGASGFGGASAAQMREVARVLNLPPLAPVDADHVLTRTFYLLNTFPGRWRGGRVWAEAPPRDGNDGDAASDIPQFDRVDDNVSPVVVGSADWASAWAIDEQGFPMFAVGRAGDRQREMAIRFGVNVVMYALTGNYKSDQVHAPEVLRRLGQ